MNAVPKQFAPQTASTGRAVDRINPRRAKLPAPPDPHRLLASLRYPKLRDGSSGESFKEIDDDLKLLWHEATKLRLSDEVMGSASSAAIQFTHAKYMQAVQAFVRSGRELPEHRSMKESLRTRHLSKEFKAFDRKTQERQRQDARGILKTIEVGEAALRTWTDRKKQDRMRQLAERARKLDVALTEIYSSPALYCKAAPVLIDPCLQGMRVQLRKLQKIDQQRPTQSEHHQRLRKSALVEMANLLTSATGTPRWAFLSVLIYVASGKTFAILAGTLRKEHDAISGSSNQERGVLTGKRVKTPRDTE